MSLTVIKARRSVALLSLAALGVTACSAGAASTRTAASPAASVAPTTTMPMPAAVPGPAVATDAVAIQGFKFGPATITVKAGSTVTWTNKDDEAHTVFFAFDGSRSPILVNNNNVYTKSFSTPGTYTYHCTIHPFMTGTVTVTA